ncbi:MAG: DUF4980 domain-containing protein, partial [Duncaniella sp.]|nr:DUF4980 domain-containing protein [Duncaniella sp.]
MRHLTKGFITALIMTAISSAAPVMADESVEINHLGVNNTLVRVKDQGHYLLLPIQEANDDARISVLVDGKLEKVFYARLAKTKIDYYTPFDLTPYKDHNVILDVVTDQNRASVRDAQNDACWKNFKVSDTFDTANREKFRPVYHHTPQWGWMNDPNGMVYKDGVWHLYYQWNPYGSKWQNMTWGHSTSRDLIHWEPQHTAIEPNGLGTVFSGSSVLDPANTAGFGSDAIVSLYTSADVSQIQSLAWSNDGGQTFTVYPGNPVLTLDSEARDPNMFWDARNNCWVLALAHALDHEMLIFTSPDLKNWTLQSAFGKGLGAQDGVWECPDLFELPVDGTDRTKWVLVCNLNPGGIFGGSATQYFVGDFDGKTFTVDTDADGSVPTKWMDFGKDHYATVSWSDAPDARRVVLGWMSNWQYAAEVPTMQFRSANTLPRDVALFTAPDGRIYMSSTPSPELLALRGKPSVASRKASLSASGSRYALPADGLCEITLNLIPQGAGTVTLTLSNEAGEHVDMVYDVKAATLSFDRTASGLSDFCQDFACATFAPTYGADDTLGLRICIDRSSSEVVGNDGR